MAPGLGRCVCDTAVQAAHHCGRSEQTSRPRTLARGRSGRAPLRPVNPQPVYAAIRRAQVFSVTNDHFLSFVIRWPRPDHMPAVTWRNAMKIGVVQMNSGSDKAKNVADAERLVRCVAAQDKPDLVVLP